MVSLHESKMWPDFVNGISGGP
uniref:Uncharacterized protein n=1 Tax=Rhizophora mucronata TaxID=61149 RepID=A0A2P2R3F2_RHIMU